MNAARGIGEVGSRMPASRRHGWRAGCLVALVIVAVAGPRTLVAQSYLVTDEGVGGAVVESYEPIGQSVLVQPGTSGSFESLNADPAAVAGDGWADGTDFVSACADCGDQGCAACGSGCRPDGGCHGRHGCLHRFLGPACPRWVVQVDALMLWQGNIASRPLLSNASGITALDANQALTPMSAGPRAALFFNLDQCRAIEANYFIARAFDGNAFLPSAAYTPQALSGFVPPNPSTAALYTSGVIQSAEMNWRRSDCSYPLTWLGGFRWVEWNQDLTLVSNSATVSPTGIGARTGNDLFGSQIGADLGLWNSGGRLTVNGVGKAGVFLNHAYQRTSGTFDINGTATPQGLASAEKDGVAFFGEAGINANFAVSRWLSWRMGYSLFWLSGVAVPANQLGLASFAPAPPTATINTGGSVLLHGVTTGLEARW